MNQERWRQIQALFSRSLELPQTERERWLAEQCGNDPELREAVQQLLTQDETGDTSVGGVIRRAASEVLDAQPLTLVGQRIGPWRLTQRIATGGMGAVYLAERADGQYEQRAAVKLINPAMLSQEALQRFNSERQILARLNHPNIARLIDGGANPDGAPWLAMEYIEGLPIDQYCERAALDARDRLQLFLKVCAAVDYAHRNLVVHRDLKPSNILVDASGEPKLLDFGVAKLLRPDGAPDLAATAADLRALTPRYASPEQVLGDLITTATDVYSLSVLLYELLVGVDPYGASATPQGLHRAIVETEPERPSTAARRSSDALRVGAVAIGDLRGDLDDILLHGLRKEPAMRYASVQALSDDIERYLRDEPVAARAGTLRYRTGKFLKRHRRTAIAAAVVLAIIIGQSAFFVQRLVAERDAAEAARVRAESTAEFVQEMLRGADRFASIGQEVTVRDVLESGAKRIATQLANQPIERARFTQTIADSYRSLSLYEQAKTLTDQALALRREHLGERHIETLESMRTQAVLTSLLGDARTAAAMLEKTLTLQTAALGADSQEIASTRYELGAVLRGLGEATEALRELRLAFDILSKLPGEHPEKRFRPHVMNEIGNVFDLMGERDAALDAYRQAAQLFEAAGHADDPVYGAVLHNIGLTTFAKGDSAAAVPYLQRALAHTSRTLGERTGDYETQLSSLGRVYARLERWKEAEEIMQQALELARDLYGEEHPYYAYNIVNKARLRQLEGRQAEAYDLFGMAIHIYRKAYGPYHPFLAAAEVTQAEAALMLGRAAEAEESLAAVLERMHQDPDHERHIEAMARSIRGLAQVKLGYAAQGSELMQAAHRDLVAIFDADHAFAQQAAARLRSTRDSAE